MVLENINMGSYVVLENVNEVRWHVVPIFFRETAQFITFLCTFDQKKKKMLPPPPHGKSHIRPGIHCAKFTAEEF